MFTIPIMWNKPMACSIFLLMQKRMRLRLKPAFGCVSSSTKNYLPTLSDLVLLISNCMRRTQCRHFTRFILISSLMLKLSRKRNGSRCKVFMEFKRSTGIKKWLFLLITPAGTYTWMTTKKFHTTPKMLVLMSSTTTTTLITPTGWKVKHTD